MEERDFFISYRWKMYASEARALAATAESRGYSVWVDWENPPPEGWSDEILATHLRTALQWCRYIVFFETATEVKAQAGGSSVRACSWQEYELDQAEARKLIVLYHSQDPPQLSFGQNRTVCPYHDFEDAMNQIVSAKEDHPEYFKKDGPSPCGDGGEGTFYRTMEA